ncbi:hypothetical protein C8F01DRAFT_1320989 [Mycena amicta]|nr:hypothetical protein C8F01DRAFT_1320989 [Mycena amicta]
MPRASPHHRHTIASRPSPHDKAALIYLFTECDGTIAKIGRTNDIERRRKEWARKCYPEPQTWVCRWRVPYGAKFEALVHAHYKDAGAWIHPKPCASRRCRVKHREKFDFAACGGLAGVERAVDDLLGKLGWGTGLGHSTSISAALCTSGPEKDSSLRRGRTAELGANLDDLLSNANSTLSSPLLGRACIYIKRPLEYVHLHPPHTLTAILDLRAPTLRKKKAQCISNDA